MPSRSICPTRWNLPPEWEKVQSLSHVPRTSAVEEVAPGVVRFRDTCNVYALTGEGEAVLVDFGSGAVLDHLSALGVERVTDVLVTHFHRDQVQGLARAAAEGIRIWVPPLEAELIASVDAHWERRPIEHDYDLRQDRFALLEQVEVAGTVAEYRSRRYGGAELYALPTPGHTVGSLTYLVERDGRRLAFSGDLVHGDGRVWSLAATQWSYGGIEGLAATFFSCGVLEREAPDLLLPAHGDVVEDPAATLRRARHRLEELAKLRLEDPWPLRDMLEQPWAELTPHLLRNRTSFANSYALRSDSGGALLVDFGYDVATGLTPATDRLASRPLLWALDRLSERGIERIEAVVVTHYHDDHVAGLNLLRETHGAEVWVPANVAPVLEEPARYDLPCLWHEPIAVDRVLELGAPVPWHEYELTPHALPGHTLYAAAIAFEADGKRVLATGDQHTTGDGPLILNYQYRNRYRVGDFVRTAELYRALRPDLLISGHWPAQEVTDEWVERLHADAVRVEDLHRELLPDEVDFGAEGFGARIQPYRSSVAAGETLALDVAVRNPFDRPERAVVRLVVPPGWPEPAAQELELDGLAEATVRFEVATAGVAPARRARLAADLTVGETPFGQQAEALMDLT
jgi:glyoxylase-like metal-dependent hydrolase (beta-lactamase superfamily II)